MLTSIKTICLKDRQAFSRAALHLDALEWKFSAVKHALRDVVGYALSMTGSNWQWMGHSLGLLVTFCSLVSASVFSSLLLALSPTHSLESCHSLLCSPTFSLLLVLSPHVWILRFCAAYSYTIKREIVRPHSGPLQHYPSLFLKWKKFDGLFLRCTQHLYPCKEHPLGLKPPGSPIVNIR